MATSKIQRILFALMLLVAYPVIAETGARDETLPGAARENRRNRSTARRRKRAIPM